MSQLILGIESSCDETAAAVFDSQHGMLSNVLFSQQSHAAFGGVIPELASREHIEKINSIVATALANAHVTLDDLEAIAVTHKPGLPGSLLVGVCFAKALAWVKQKHLIGVNHLEGHAFSACIENNVPFPFLCLTASGGHTSLYKAFDFGNYVTLGQTMDDAAGEAFDKIAKLLQLPYPGGPMIEKLAAEVNFQDFFSYPRSQKKSLEFSFSGLKTAVLYDLVERGTYDLPTKTLLVSDDYLKKQVASSLLVCIGDIFAQKLQLALEQNSDVRAICFVGGVACNKYLRSRLKEVTDKHYIPFFVPSPIYCTDNAGMIAFVGNYKAEKQEYSSLELDILR
jgi:N6-L-threonylcarbamoyladenine synthase